MVDPAPRRRFPRGRETGEGAYLVVIGLGSNEEGPARIDAAVEEISYEYDLLARSTRYVSPPDEDGEPVAEGTDRAGYSNAAVLIRTTQDYDTLKATLRAIEERLGRDRTDAGVVAIDLDILLLQDQIVRKGERVLAPHPDLESKRYAAIPSAEVAPFLRHAITEESLADLAARLA